jgi:hypothetical protein
LAPRAMPHRPRKSDVSAHWTDRVRPAISSLAPASAVMAPPNEPGKVLGQSRSRKSAQDDRWSFCLTAGTLKPANQERP